MVEYKSIISIDFQGNLKWKIWSLYYPRAILFPRFLQHHLLPICSSYWHNHPISNTYNLFKTTRFHKKRVWLDWLDQLNCNSNTKGIQFHMWIGSTFITRQWPALRCTFILVLSNRIGNYNIWHSFNFSSTHISASYNNVIVRSIVTTVFVLANFSCWQAKLMAGFALTRAQSMSRLKTLQYIGRTFQIPSSLAKLCCTPIFHQWIPTTGRLILRSVFLTHSVEA